MTESLADLRTQIRTPHEARAMLEAQPTSLLPVIVEDRTQVTVDQARTEVTIEHLHSGLVRRTDCQIVDHLQRTVKTVSRTPEGLLRFSFGSDEQDDMLLFDYGQQDPNAQLAIRLTNEAIDRPQAAELARAIVDALGEIPDLRERTPLFDPDHRDAIAPADAYEVTDLDMDVLEPWIDSANAAQVAQNAFGPENYRRSLARAVMSLEPEAIAFYALFVGLVPIDHIDAAMAQQGPRLPGHFLGTSDRAGLRALLAELPDRLLSRFLSHDDPGALVIALRDAVRDARRKRIEPARIAQVVGLAGHSSIRRPADLEALIRRMPPSELTLAEIRAREAERVAPGLFATLHQANLLRNEQGLDPIAFDDWTDPEIRRAEDLRTQAHLEEQRLAAMAEQERAEIEERRAAEKAKAAWVDEMAPRLDSAPVGPGSEGLRLVVARSADQLTDWSASMNNCIDTYAENIGTSILAAVIAQDEPDRPLLNLEVSHEKGLVQLLGKNNCSAVSAMEPQSAQKVLDDLIALGVDVGPSANGISKLKLPQTD